jgi:hypothetical protein
LTIVATPLIEVPPPKKLCGGCTACCSTVPVEEISLPAFTRCPKLRPVGFAAPGCSIYPDRPRGCKVWNCQWLAEDDWPEELRPDRCGVVVDILPDIIIVNGREMPALQMWAAPHHELAFDTQPVLGAVLAVIESGYAVIWRWRGKDGQQTARALLRDPQTGEIVASAETPPDKKFSAKVPVKERLRRAMAHADNPNPQIILGQPDDMMARRHDERGKYKLKP